MRVLTNPAFLQMIALFLMIAAVLVIAMIMIRNMRKGITSELAAVSAKTRTEAPDFAAATYQGVIAGLKQREQQLLGRLSAETKRAESVEQFKTTVLDNISTGVMMFSSNLLVQQANSAARKLLGYASPLNMHVKEVFNGLRAVELPSSNGALGGISQALRDVFTTGSEYRDVPATYCTPQGEARQFRLILLPVQDETQQISMVLCLIGPPDTAFTLSFPGSEAGKNSMEAE